MMEVPLLSLKKLYAEQRDEINAAIARVVESQVFIQGPEVLGLESEVEAFLGGGAHAIGCGSGSDAIVLALKALGVGPGDEVITPVHSFTSTATSVDIVGATPVFVDVEEHSLNLDPRLLAAALTDATKAVVAVHLFGRCADVHAVRRELDSAGRQDVLIIEDAAQSLGARLRGEAACTIGALATTSFFPTKNLGAFGDGGMCFAKSEVHASDLRALRAHGAREKYKAEMIGFNSRLDSLQAAVLRVKLPALDRWSASRRRSAARYHELFGSAGLQGFVTCPPAHDDEFEHIYNQFNLRVSRRDELQAFLQSKGVGTAVYYPRTLAQQPCYSGRGFDDVQFPIATAAAADSLAIPVAPGTSAEAQHYVVAQIAAFYGV
ncbi:MAG: dTDP-4-amino-4,6-dideoxygalactose transaminase [Bradymonadia bacterium]|jgi:dTDP-4-amino-4,6-dideoxygalactose transaminase